MANFYFSQTAVKDLEKEETCPVRWKNQWLDRAIPFQSSEDLDKGKYFEQLLLGASSKKEEVIDDLPRLASGTKSTDQIRIEQQAERGKRLLFNKQDPEYLGFVDITSQVSLFNEEEKTSGVLDIVCKDSYETHWIIDLKLTKDLTNNRTEYGWGNNPEDMDLMQLVHYSELYIHNFNIVPKIGVLIFDYSPKKRVKFIELEISKNKILEKIERFNAAKEAVSLYGKLGWSYLPSVKECGNCPLLCSSRKIESPIVKQVVKY